MSSPTKSCLPTTIAALWDALPYVKDKGEFQGINRPTAEPRSKEPLPKGSNPIQLYTLGTPNGKKAQIMLEELKEEGISGFEYDSHTIKIWLGDQFTEDFSSINPNQKIPCMTFAGTLRLFESGSILKFLAEKSSSKLLPSDADLQAEVYNWVFWAIGGLGPMTGQFGHFYVYAPREFSKDHVEYGVSRYGMEALRHLSVLDKALETRAYLAGDQYTIADIAAYPWAMATMSPKGYKNADGVTAHDFLEIEGKFKNVERWAAAIAARPAVVRATKE